MTPSVTLHRDGRLATVTLRRPDRRNSFDLAMLARFEEVLHLLGQDTDTDVVVLTGAGSAFCAGTDLDELATLDVATTMAVQRRTADLVERWYRLEQTTVTVFNGPAIGSGAVLGLASDLRVAADSCFFSFPEVTFGIPLTWSGMAILADLVGADRAKRWLLLGERIEPARLRALELVTDVVPVDQLDAARAALSDRLLSVSPVGRSMTKRAARLAGPRFEAAAADSYLGALSVALRPPGDYPKGTAR
ncbi:enoyl-CoA hydratase/isomerase family protein [Solwaraspora sp. WMMD406]|uniref:enoyl-CoA hydratase/isomerase family protein n=1 Tax=Solwaraspora sp. WMMD406 TaxID=3016095 RepID=UPI0024172856|nr:enoyl-CoA hydratase/isomerase family protein [Solwaraspora sp. WMMD406]MDG4766057.1 enoyl-CoA hydratase/isomerase family protein [Solwaraspora sp. WMMD406]